MLHLGNFRVNWQHFNPNQDLVIFDEYGRKYVRQLGAKEFFGTKCFIYSTEKAEGELLSVGIAKLHKYNTKYNWSLEFPSAPKGGNGFDIYNKEVGRRRSLENALANLDLTKEQKREIWRDYDSRIKHLINVIID